MKNLFFLLVFFMMIGCVSNNEPSANMDQKETKAIGIYSESNGQIYKLTVFPDGKINFVQWDEVVIQIQDGDGDCSSGANCDDCDSSIIMQNGVKIYCKAEFLSCKCEDIYDSFGNSKVVRIKTCDCDTDPNYPSSGEGGSPGTEGVPITDWIWVH